MTTLKLTQVQRSLLVETLNMRAASTMSLAGMKSEVLDTDAKRRLEAVAHELDNLAVKFSTYPVEG